MAKNKTASSSDVKKFSSQTLKSGSKGPAVGFLQQQLNDQAKSKLSVDEDFGSGTKSAVKSFQKKNKLSVDGIVGPNTWGALTSKGRPNAAPKKEATGKRDEKKDKQNKTKGDKGKPDSGCVVNVRVFCISERGGKMPVQGAEVRLANKKAKTRTNGDATLSVKPGRHRFQVTKAGYKLDESKSYELIAIQGGRFDDYPIELKHDRKRR